MHLYIHVPFCRRRCSYCDFAIAIRRETPAAEFVDAVLREWEARRQHPAWGDSPRIASMYLGGGTPSRLPPSAIARLIERITSNRPLAEGAEITLEANPEDVSPQSAGAWRTAGVNRLSIGAQSFDDRVLAQLRPYVTVVQPPGGRRTAPKLNALTADPLLVFSALQLRKHARQEQ